MVVEKHIADTPKWVALYTRSRAEKRVAERLEESGVEVYLPLIKIRRKWSDRWKIVEEPLIKSYVFVKIRRREQVKVTQVDGVVYIVKTLGVPSVIPERDINYMRRLVEANVEVHVVDNTQLKNGARVRIEEGWMKGMEGMVLEDCQDGNFSISISGLDFSLVLSVQRELLRVLE